jgi:hypothetical protein
VNRDRPDYDAALVNIDNTVDGRCACGCGTHLDDTSPSGWFATQECQWIWQSQHGDRPMWPSAPRNVAAIPPAPQTPPGPLPVRPHPRPPSPAAPVPDEYLFRRTCPHCTSSYRPTRVTRVETGGLPVGLRYFSEPIRPTTYRTYEADACPGCRYVFPGPALTGQVSYFTDLAHFGPGGPHLRFYVSDGDLCASYILSYHEMTAFRGSTHILAADIWARLIRLVEAEREGTTARTAQSGQVTVHAGSVYVAPAGSCGPWWRLGFTNDDVTLRMD